MSGQTERRNTCGHHFLFCLRQIFEVAFVTSLNKFPSRYETVCFLISLETLSFKHAF